jgi:hypothetical protein
MRSALVNQLALFAALAPAVLWAADVWEAKPFQDWTDKDIQKVVDNSPWARQTRAVLGNAASIARGTSAQPAVSDASSNDTGVNRAGRGAGGAARLGSAPDDLDQGPQSLQQSGVPVIIRWQSALPLRQAQMRGKYGKEAATSPDAQRFLAQEPSVYVVGVAGLAGSIVSAGAGDQAKQSIVQKTTLTVKGKEPLRPIAVDFVPNGTAVDVLIGFSRAMPITLEDQEVELASQIGGATVRYKFKLKDMVVRGKLEL